MAVHPQSSALQALGSAHGRLITGDFRLPRPPRRLDCVRSTSVAYEFVHFGLWNCEPETNLGREVSRCAERQSGETSTTIGQALGDVSSLAHRKRPRRTQPLVAKRRTDAAKRERPGREARAFTLNRSASRFRGRLLK